MVRHQRRSSPLVSSNPNSASSQRHVPIQNGRQNLPNESSSHGMVPFASNCTNDYVDNDIRWKAARNRQKQNQRDAALVGVRRTKWRNFCIARQHFHRNAITGSGNKMERTFDTSSDKIQRHIQKRKPESNSNS